jgi:hypothetical protein
MKTINLSILMLAIIYLLAVQAASAQDRNPPTTTKETGATAVEQTMNANVEEQIKALHEEARQAAFKGDTTWQEKYLVDDIVGIGPDGKMVTKEQMIQMRKSGRVKFEQLEERDVKIRLYGETAILNATVFVREIIDGKLFSGHHSASFVFVKQKGIWKEIGFQQTPVLEK